MQSSNSTGSPVHTYQLQKGIHKSRNRISNRIQEVKDDNFHYTGPVDVDELNTAVDILEEQEKMAEDMKEIDPAILGIFSIISLYTTFVKDEPIHQVGTLFPGGFTVKKEGDKYTCPVKDNNDDNPLALCPFCIAEQDAEV